jgi:prolyl-tRNA synthetase
MKLSRYSVPTLKEIPSDAVVTSHRLMIRAGLIRKEAAGMYVYLPLGVRALRKVTEIVREEMDRTGAQEFLMPELTNADLWKESGRWSTMGPEMFRIKDRNDLEYALGPTHEEAFTNIIRTIVTSYKDLPINAYQINTKFRDEIRPRFGVIRSKEFIMKDAYSFDIDEKGLDESYKSMAKAYRAIFRRCGLETIPVQADTGNMGGSASEEFMVASEVGEETLLLCECGYRANQEKAEYKRMVPAKETATALEEVATPDVKSIDDLVKFFNCGADKFLKSIIYVADGKPVMAVAGGSREINETKLKKALGCNELEIAPEGVVVEATKAPVGFAGPVRISGLRIIFDLAVKDIANAITGANKKDLHFKGVNPGRDFEIKEEADITSAVEGDLCAQCEKKMYVKKGLEVGHIFKLGYKYTKAMNVTVTDEHGGQITPIMGCYGIGVTRTLAAVVEQHNDDKGLKWPMSVAPFHVHLVGITKTDEEKAVAESMYELMTSCGIEVLYDDRSLSPGIKFADADLIGLPMRVTVGKTFFTSRELELKFRATGEMIKLQQEDLVKTIKKHIEMEIAALKSS